MHILALSEALPEMQRHDHKIVVVSKSHTQSMRVKTDTPTQYRHAYSVYNTNLFIKVDTLLNNCLKCGVGLVALSGKKPLFPRPSTTCYLGPL